MLIVEPEVPERNKGTVPEDPKNNAVPVLELVFLPTRYRADLYASLRLMQFSHDADAIVKPGKLTKNA